jgi:RTX calcium-binding nonapeptide repeat (4 copies)
MAQTINIAAGGSAASIQAAIYAAPAGAIIRLAAGTYSFDRTVVIDRDDITVTGAGAGATVITTRASMGGDPAFRIGDALFKEDLGDGVSMSYAPQGARTITVAGGHTFRRGDAIWIETANDADLFREIGDTQWRGDQPLRTALAMVTSVNGNKITLDRDLPFAFKFQATSVHEVDLVSGVALRNMTLKGSYGTSDPGDFANREAGANGGMMLLVNTSKGVTLSGIEIKEPGSNGMVIAKSIDAQVRDLTVTGAHNKGDGGNGYGLWIRDVSDSDFQGLRIHDTRHAVLFASVTSASGNTVQVDDTNRDINFHGGLDHDNLVTVNRSVHGAAGQGYVGSATFVNPGTDYGAPTDPDANTILFRQVVGTVRADDVRGMSGGARLTTLGGNDTLTGGNGSDRLDGGTGDDLIRGSRGSDTVIGGYGSDTVDFDVWRSTVTLSVSNGQLLVRGDFGVTRLSGVEYVTFENGRDRVADLISQAARAAAADAFVFRQTQGLSDETVWQSAPEPGQRDDAADSVAVAALEVAALEVDPVVLAATDRFDFV